MKKKTTILYLLLFAAGLFLIALSGSSPKEKSPLQLELVLPKHKFEAGEPIECKALLTYTGEEEIKVYFRNPMVFFVVDGGEYMHENQYGWAVRDILNIPAVTRVLKIDEPLEIPFQKQQYSYSFLQRRDGDEAAKDFWESYRSTSDLILEPGRYKIFARCGYSLDKVTAHGPFEEIVVSERITVK